MPVARARPLPQRCWAADRLPWNHQIAFDPLPSLFRHPPLTGLQPESLRLAGA